MNTKNSFLPVKPDLFWEAFSQTFHNKWKNDKKEFEKIYSSDKLYTEFIYSIVPDAIKKLGLETFSEEYWPRYDFAVFNKETSNEWDKWSLEIAIEHENNIWPAWQNECRKLMLGIAGLKVLITYRNKCDVELEKALKEFADIYKSRQYHQEHENWLFIFGPTIECWNDYDFTAYSFNGAEFKKLKEMNTFKE
jgi:hypothetical protein